jgi:exodeoxyribonuclease-3
MHQSRQKNNGWRIDYFLVSKDFEFEDSSILTEVMGSDHAPCFISF